MLNVFFKLCKCRPSQTLNEDQTTWIKDASEKVTKILVETPPDGEQFTQAVKVSALYLNMD